MKQNYIDGNNRKGVHMLDGASVYMPTGATTDNEILNHDTAGDYGIYSQRGGRCIGATGQVFTNNDDDEEAHAASFGYHN